MANACGVLDDDGNVTAYRLTMKQSDDIGKRSLPGFYAWHDRDANRVVPITLQQFKRGEWGDYHVLFDGRKGVEKRFEPTQRRSFDEIVEHSYSDWNQRAPNPLPTTIFDSRALELQQICLALKAGELPQPEMDAKAEEFELPQVGAPVPATV